MEPLGLAGGSLSTCQAIQTNLIQHINGLASSMLPPGYQGHSEIRPELESTPGNGFGELTMQLTKLE